MTETHRPAPPETVHGLTIVAATYTPRGRVTRDGHVILVDRGQDGDPPHRWITGWLGIGDSGWLYGHYFATERDARDDYADRVRRGY